MSSTRTAGPSPAFVAPTPRSLQGAPGAGVQLSRRAAPAGSARPAQRRRAVPMAQAAWQKGPLTIARDAQRVYGKTKPPWCQPWTILGTGVFVIFTSWELCHGWASVVAVGVTGAVLLWWYAFLVVYPQSELGE